MFSVKVDSSKVRLRFDALPDNLRRALGLEARSLTDELAGRARANAAQHNSFEAFPFFAASVILATLAGVDGPRVDQLSVVFIVARWLYVFFYVTDRPIWRTVCWTVAYVCVVSLMAISI